MKLGRGVVLIVATAIAGCGTSPAAGTAGPTLTPSLAPTPSPTPTPQPTPTSDAALGEAVADALASIDEIVRLTTNAGPHPVAADYSLIAEVATSERTSLAREPARITTMLPFHQLDLALQIIELNDVLNDPAQLREDNQRLVELRLAIAALR
jgi:hypothetical protein